VTNFEALRIGKNRASNGDAPLGGFSASPVFVYRVVPPTLHNSALAVAAAVSGGNWTLAANTGVTTVTINGRTYYDLGVARVVTLSGAQTSAVAVDVTITGLDDYKVPVTQTLSSPASTALVSTTKAFRYVASVATAGNTVGTVSVGTGDTFGLPVAVSNWGDVWVTWNDVKATANTGFTAAVTTDPATAYTGDVRGTYAVQGASSNSARVLDVWIYVINPDTRLGLYGVAQA